MCVYTYMAMNMCSTLPDKDLLCVCVCERERERERERELCVSSQLQVEREKLSAMKNHLNISDVSTAM